MKISASSRLLRLTMFSLLLVGLLAASAAGLLYMRLLHGSVSLAMLTPTIERLLSDELGDKVVRVESVELRLDDDRSLMVALTQVAVAEADGTTLVHAPEARAGISWPALKRGRLALGSVDLVAPRLHLAAAPDGGVTLSFAKAATSTAASTAAVPPAAASDSQRLDLVKVLAETSARARRRENATGFLREVGLKRATVVVSNGQHRTVWNVPEFKVDLSHRRAQSSIAGKATIATLAGPMALTFNTQEDEKSDHITLDVSVDGFNPRGLARLIPGLGLAENVDLPLTAKAQFVLATSGGQTYALKSAQAEATAKGGEARLGLLGRKAVSIEATKAVVSYDGARGVIDVTELSLGWNGNRMVWVGQITPEATGDGWAYALRATSGTFAGPRPSLRGAKIEQAKASGRAVPGQGKLSLQDFSLRVAGAEVSAKGDVAWSGGAPAGQIDGRLSPTSIDALNVIWPTFLAPGVRDWVATHVKKGQLAGGLFKAAIEGGSSRDGTAGEAQARLSLTLEASGVEVQTVKGMPPLEVPRGLVRVEGQTIEITAPEFVMTASEGRKLQFKTARFTAVETVAGEQPTAEIAFRLNGPLAAVADIADREALQLFKSNGLALPGLDGKLDGQLKVTFPLAENVAFSEVRSEGRVRVTDLRARQLVGQHDVSGGTLAIEIGDKVVDVKGEVLVKGVNSKLAWQYLWNQPLPQQPPVRLSAVLDNADRAALGLDVADIVLGETPVEVTVGWTEASLMQTRVRVDLTKAELTFEPIAWKKATGRPAVFQFEPNKGPGTGAAQRLELQNMKLSGDDVALEGWMALGPDNKPREFSFPEFTLNVVSRLALHGKRRPDNVWEINAKGSTFDGREVFRSLFSVGQGGSAARKDKPGYDLSADIETVIGFSDTVLRSVRLKLGQRADKLSELDLRATLATGKPFVATLRQLPGVGRQLLAQGDDAGQVFKVVGFYPNAVGGLMQLEVNLDAKGANEKSGTLWARDFAVLGDPIISEVYQNAASPSAGQGPNQPKTRQRVVRQQFDFDGIVIPFDVGSGQFVMNNAVLRGPIIGATFRGKIDFKQQVLNLGGTYVPLSGLNQAVGGILGPLTGGAQGEGLFGITFAVQGALANPQVIVNPLSLLTPGIFREILQMTPDTFRITPRSDTVAPAALGVTAPKTRTRTAPPIDPVRAPAVAPPRPQGEVLPDWSSDVKPTPKRPVEQQQR